MSAIVERSGHLSLAECIPFHACVCIPECVCYISAAWNDPSECVFAYMLFCSLCLHTCCMNCTVCVCVSARLCLLHSRLAPMWGSKSIIAVAFTYHFTEQYVQCKQRLSLHANEPLSSSLHKDSIYSHHGILPACWIWYLRLQAYS